MLDVQFGAGNIGRGFIGETLADNDFSVTFIDHNQEHVDALNEKHGYKIELAEENHEVIEVHNIQAINNGTHPEDAAAEIAKADMVTTAIGARILESIAPIIADGIKQRRANGNTQNMDVVACENMKDGSQTLKKYVYDSLDDEDKKFADEHIGFPNAAVDRIVPGSDNSDDPLKVTVEPSKEWIIEETQMKNPDLKLKGVDYVDDLDPYIERKMYSVNTGHATIAYVGNIKGYETIGEAIQDKDVLMQFKNVLDETGQLLVSKWDKLDRDSIQKYQKHVVERFQNQYISDDVERVGRTPIRKLGFNERFIKPIREAKERNLDYGDLIDTVGTIFFFDFPNDDESVKLQKQLKENSIEDVIKEDCGLDDQDIIDQIAAAYNKYKK